MVFISGLDLRKRKKMWFENSLLDRTRLSGFLLLSLGIHITFVIAHMLIPVKEKVVKGPPPIQVKYVESKKDQDLKYGKIVDAPKPPLKKEKPKSKELLAKFDNRSHSNKKTPPKKNYKRKKTIVPKSRGIIGSSGSRIARAKKVPTKKKFQKKSFPKTRKNSLSDSDIGHFKSITPKKLEEYKPPLRKDLEREILWLF